MNINYSKNEKCPIELDVTKYILKFQFFLMKES